MVDKSVDPAFGIPNKFKTPAQMQRERLEKLGEIKPRRMDMPYLLDVHTTLGFSTASSFLSGFAGDAKTLDYVFDSDLTKDTEANLRDMSAFFDDRLPQKVVDAREKKFIEDDGSLGAAWGDLYAYLDLAGSGLGSIGAMVLGGGLLKMAAKGGLKMMVAKSIQKKADDIMAKQTGGQLTREAAVAKAKKEVKDISELYDSAIGTGAYGTAEMAIVSGSVGHAIEEEVLRAPAAVLNESDRFKEIYFDLMDNNEKLTSDQAHNMARIKLSREAGVEGAKTVAIPSLLLGSVAGRYIDKAISGRLTKSTLKNFAILEGIEIPTEAAQGATEQLVQNKVYKDLVDKTRNLMEGVPDAAVREGLGVAFGVAPLSAISAKAEAAQARGNDPDYDELTLEEQGVMIDAAAKVDEDATMEAQFIADGKEKFKALLGIIRSSVETGIPSEETPAAEAGPEMDLDLTPEALAELEREDAPAEMDLDLTPEALAELEADEEIDLPLTPEQIEAQLDEETTAPETTAPGAGGNLAQGQTDQDLENLLEPDETQTGADETQTETPTVVNRQAAIDGAGIVGANLGVNKALQSDDAARLVNRKSKERLYSADKFDQEKAVAFEAVTEGQGLEIQQPEYIIDDRPGFMASGGYDVETNTVHLSNDPTEWTPVGGDGVVRPERTVWHEIGHWGFHEALNGGQRIAAATGIRESRNDDLIEGKAGHHYPKTKFDDMDEYFAEMYSNHKRGQPTDDRFTEMFEAIDAAVDPAVPEQMIQQLYDEVVQKPEVITPPPEPETEKPDVSTPPPAVDKPAEKPVDKPTELPPGGPVIVEQDENVPAIEEALLAAEAGKRYVISGINGKGEPMTPKILEYMDLKNDKYRFLKGKARSNIILHEGSYWVAGVSSPNRAGRKTMKITGIAPHKQKVKDTEGNIGGTIRRWYELFKRDNTPDDATKLLKAIDAVVAKSMYYNSIRYSADAPGTKRMVADVFGKIPTFYEWVGPYIGAQRWQGGVTNKQAVLAILKGEPKTEYRDTRVMNIQTIDELNDVVQSYVSLMQDMTQLLQDPKNTQDVHDRLVYDALPQAEVDSRWKRNNEGELAQLNYFGKDELLEGSLASQYEGLYPQTLHHLKRMGEILFKHKKHEHMDEAHFTIARQRHDLTDLAEQRHGMPDWREGRDVTGDEIIKTFQFAGITYGEHVEDVSIDGKPSEAQQYRNLAYDAFRDLAFLTGLDTKAIGNNLYLSIGALGHGGKHAAFFSPNYPKISLSEKTNRDELEEILDLNRVGYSKDDSIEVILEKVEKVVKRENAKLERIKVIHFNRNSGDGSLAHEWAHYLGNLLKYMETGIASELKDYISSEMLRQKVDLLIQRFIKMPEEKFKGFGFEVSGLRHYIEKTLEYRGDFAKRTEYYSMSRKIKPTQYWANDKELFARAIESYIYDKMNGDDSGNPFLQDPRVAEGVLTKDTGYYGTPYPTGEERSRFNQMFEYMFDLLELHEGVAIIEKNNDMTTKYGSHAQFEREKQDILDNIEAILEQAQEDRLEYQLNLIEGQDDRNLAENMTDQDLESILEDDEVDDEPEPGKPRRPPRKPRKPRDPDAPKLQDQDIEAKKEKTKDDADAALKENGIENTDGLDDLFDMFSGGVRFSLTEDLPEGLNPEQYEKVVKVLRPWLAQYEDSGKQNLHGFGRIIRENLLNKLPQMKPYALQFLKDYRDGKFTTTDLRTTLAGTDPGAEGTGDGTGTQGGDQTGVSDAAGDETTAGTGAGADTGTGAAETGTGDGAGVDVTTSRERFKSLSMAEQSEWIYEETGLPIAFLEPLPRSIVEETAAQVPKVPIANRRDNESDYQVPASMSDNIENAVRTLDENLEGGIDEFIREQLGYDSLDEVYDAFMSLQAESIAMAIHQMQRGKGVIIADQTGVGKGRQAGALIRWAIKQGKTPVFVTQKKELYTDMYYDMVDSNTDFMRPFITNTKVGVKQRQSEEEVAAGKEPEVIYRNTDNTAALADMAKTGKMPGDSNVIFTTYDQMNRAGARRNALSSIVENNDTILILDESHSAAGQGSGVNEYFSDLIREAQATTYLSATFAKRPDNLAFYFNTDLSDAVDNIKQLVDILSKGGTQLQEVMSQMLTRNGQLFRREISYEGIEIKTEFDTTDPQRDRKYSDRIMGHVRPLIKANMEATKYLEENHSDPVAVAAEMFANGDISQEDMARVEEQAAQDRMAVASGEKPLMRVNYTPINNQIHILIDNLMVAAKTDAAAAKMIDDIQNGRKPIVGLDKTGGSMLEQFIEANEKSVGDDMSDMNWGSILETFANKTYRASISIRGDKLFKPRGRIKPDNLDEQMRDEITGMTNDAKADLADIDLPTSPIDYIQQKAEAVTGKKIGEITGRDSGGWGIDYNFDKDGNRAGATLKKITPFNRRNIIDAFNGGEKPADGSMVEGDIAGLIINQSGSTGISAHSSTKHGDRRDRHMIIIEPSGDINVFQQMLGRIFRTGMGGTMPYYTVLGSSIPADTRKITVLRKKMESLNAQTSSNKEGAAGVNVVDFINMYGDRVVADWVRMPGKKNGDFKAMYPNWEQKLSETEGEGDHFSYWASGKIGLFDTEVQDSFYETVGEKYTALIEELNQAGENELEQQFKNYQAKARESITLAQPKPGTDGKGFASGAYLVRYVVDLAFNPMKADEIVEEVKKNAKFDDSKAQPAKDEIIESLKEEEEEARKMISEVTVDPARELMQQMYDSAYAAIIEDKPTKEDYMTDLDNLGKIRDNEALWGDRGSKKKYEDAFPFMNRMVKMAQARAETEQSINQRFKVGSMHTMEIGGEKFKVVVTNHEYIPATQNPWAMGNVNVSLAANGGANDRFKMRLVTMNNKIDQRTMSHVNEDPTQEDYRMEFEVMGQTSKTAERWIAVGNPLVAASEIIPRGKYIRFSDEYERYFMGIEIPPSLLEYDGIESVYRGNAEVGDPQVIIDYLTDNPIDEHANERGFQTRMGTVRVTADPAMIGNMMVRFRNEDAGEIINDRPLNEMLKRDGYSMSVGDSLTEFSVPLQDAKPYLNQIMSRARLVVLNTDKDRLADYMELPVPQQAQKKSALAPGVAHEIQYEGGARAVKGKYKGKKPGAKEHEGYYFYGIDQAKLTKINPLSARMRNEGGGYFVFLSKFTDGTVEKHLGSPLVTLDANGSAFMLGPVNPNNIKAENVKTTLAGLPFRMGKWIKVIQSENDLPKEILMKVHEKGARGMVRGAYHNGKIYIVADNLSSNKEAVTVFLHEAVGHFGLRELMGADFNDLLDQVYKLYPAEIKRIGRKYKLNLQSKAGRREAADELLAEMAESIDEGIIEKIVNWLRGLLVKMGVDLKFTQRDVRNILHASRRFVAAGGLETGTVLNTGEPRLSIRSSTEVGGAAKHEDTVAQAIKDGQPVDAVFRGLYSVVEATQIPSVIKKTSAASMRGAMNFYDKHMPWAHAAMDHIAKGVIDRYGLTEEYKHLIASTASKKAEIINEVRDIIDMLEGQGVTAEQSTKLYEILTNEAPREEAWDAVSEPIRKRIEELGQQAVDLGLISQETYDNNKGAYLHRVYRKYEENRSGLQKFSDNLTARKKKIVGHETMERGLSFFVPMERIMSNIGIQEDEFIDEEGNGITLYKVDKLSENRQKVIKTTYSLSAPKLEEDEADAYKVGKFTVRGKHGGKVKLWRDWTKQEREDMGEITDARYVLGKTFALLAHDISTGDFFKQISMNPAWTWQEAGEPDDFMEGDKYSDKKYAVVTGAEWVKVPDTKIPKSQAKKYGALAGKYIRAEIFQDINATINMQKGGWWKDLMTSFKLNKTARNPVVHFNNIMSNFVLMDMADVRFSDLYRAILEMSNKGDLYREAKANGAMGVSFAEQELKKDVMDKLLDEIHESLGGKPPTLEEAVLAMDKLPMNKQIAFLTKLADKLWSGFDVKGKKVGLRVFDEKMLSYYQHEDEVFRMATYMRRRAQGMSEVEAGIAARDQFLNYDINAPWINALRASVMPFLSYTYRAVPIVAKSLAQRPWKLAKYFTIAYGMNALGYALSGGDEEKERRSLRDDVTGMLWIGSHRYIRMPWSDENTNPYFWDVRRLIPVGDVFDMNQHHAALPIIPASLMPSGPIAMGFEFMLNKTSFFGEQIVDPLADDPLTKTEKTVDWLWKSFGPSAPWIPYSYYWDKMGIAATGGRDRLGREYSVPEALASSFGIKIARHDVTYGMALKAMEIERTVEAIRHRLSFIEKDRWQGKISKEKADRLSKRYMRSLKQLEEKARQLLNP